MKRFPFLKQMTMIEWVIVVAIIGILVSAFMSIPKVDVDLEQSVHRHHCP